VDKPPSDLRKSNQSIHEHLYELKGGPMFWAECECGEKLNRGNGVLCGSRGKMEAAMVATLAQKS
jgi:hypothetical protein